MANLPIHSPALLNSQSEAGDASPHRTRVWWGIVVGPRMPVTPGVRATWGLVALLGAGILGVALYLRPNAAGHGTHEALGMPPCGFLLRTRLPCPTCGMTTSFAHFVRGQWLRAFVVQPAGMVMAILTVLLTIMAATIAATGWTLYVDWDRAAVRLMLGFGLLILFGWVFKMVESLLSGRVSQ
ncbi:MAG TPA: DUF2752 domain-containing protein [Phycisphaerae bacterium]|nr:DUF2752 domain-containing protein [Phycisphaerae bacterium]